MTARHLYPTAYAPARHRHQRRLTRRSLWLFVHGLAGGVYLTLVFAAVVLGALWRRGVIG